MQCRVIVLDQCDYMEILEILNTLTLMLQLGGGILPTRRTFYPVALKPLWIVTKAFVTFPEYMRAKNAEKNSDISTGISNMAAEKWTTDEKSSKILC